MKNIYLAIVLAPLIGALVAGLFGRKVGRSGAHWVTSIGVAISFVLSLVVFKHIIINDAPAFNGSIYTWMVSDGIKFEIGFLVDELTALMMVVVTFVSLMVHIYTIGYMRDDPGYQRFFCYIALFTKRNSHLRQSQGLFGEPRGRPGLPARHRRYINDL